MDNVYESNKGICPKCGAELPEHWKKDNPPKKPSDTGFLRICPNCGESLFTQQSNS